MTVHNTRMYVPDDREKVILRMLTGEIKPSLRDISGQLHVTVGAVQQRVSKLAKLGLVRKGEAHTHRNLTLTDLGRQAIGVVQNQEVPLHGW